MTTEVRTIVCGGSGYVAGELLRLLAGHPTFSVKATLSGSHGGEPVNTVFPHLAADCSGMIFAPRESIGDHLDPGDPIAIFAAGPHGDSAVQIDSLLTLADDRGAEVRLVDLSADFRYAEVGIYEHLYGKHGAPHRVGQFHSSLPEHGPQRLRRHVGNPGCFTTSVVLPGVPLIRLGLVSPVLRVTGITGSSGSGRNPKPGTHHPERSGNVYAYSPLRHRHEPEMGRLIYEASGIETDVRFVPHSGPFVRGILSTIHADLVEPLSTEQVAAALAEFYADCPFVTVVPTPPKVKDVAGTNQCRLGVAVSGRSLVVVSVIDNLIKGAAGGAIHWMNRLFDLDDDAGLQLSGLGWY